MSDNQGEDELDDFLAMQMRNMRKRVRQPSPERPTSTTAGHALKMDSTLEISAASSSAATAVDEKLEHPQPSPASSPAHDASGPKFHRDPLPSVYRHWVPRLATPLAPARASRGAQKQKLRCASICSGLAPEDETPWLFGIECDMIFDCDGSPHAIRFHQQNRKFGVRHSFISVQHMLGGEGLCTEHGYGVCKIEVPKRWLHVLIAGISCRSYTTTRTNRQQSWQNHADSWLIDAWLTCLLRYEPLSSILENVMGFLKPDRASKTTPLEVLVKQFVEKGLAALYVMRIYVVNGEMHLRWSRSRMYLVVLHRCVPGQWLSEMDILIEDCRSNTWSPER